MTANFATRVVSIGTDNYGIEFECQRMDVSTDLIARARAGDEDAFRELVEPHRRELRLHCYRILGSYHDAALIEGVADDAPGPEARYESKESVSLAFITALQLLPPRQRAALILRDVLGYHAKEVAQNPGVHRRIGDQRAQTCARHARVAVSSLQG